MKGHVRKRGSRWYVVLEQPRTSEGKRRQKWISAGDTKKQAEQLCAKLVHQLDTGGYVEPSKMTLAQYLDHWLEASAKPTTVAKTYERYAEIAHLYIGPKLGHIPLAKLQPLHIQTYYSEELASGSRRGNGGLSPQTVLHHHRVLHRALAQAVKWQMLARNPADAVEPPKPQRREMQALSAKQARELIDVLEGTQLHMPVLLAVLTGLRRGELLGLRWKDIDFERASLTVRRSLQQTSDGLYFKEPKTKGSKRTVALPANAVAALRSHKSLQAQVRLKLGPAYQDQGLVFADDLGNPWKPDSFTSNFRAASRRAGFHIRFHDLRHTHATMLLEQGVHPKIVSERLGHSNIGITLDTYSHVLPNMQETAAAAIERAMGGT
ncbi:MAG: tyrosine-type recombinase/integrase [Coriobacteriia bacterium]